MHEWSGRRVVVTGAAGFIGAHLCRRLVAVGADTHAVSRSHHPETPPQATSHRIDLSDRDAALKLVKTIRPEIIFHMAGLAAGSRDPDLVLPTLSSNLISTVNVLWAAEQIGKPRIVLPGSLEEPDDAIATPTSPYAASKWAASTYGRMYHSLFQMPVCIARVFITYGPTRKDLHKLIPYVVLTLLKGGTPKLSSGTRLVDWVHVDDVVAGLLSLAIAPKCEGLSIDIGSGSLVAIRDLVEILRVSVDPQAAVDFGALPDRFDEQVRVADLKRTRELIGWQPTIPLEEGLRSTVAWFKEHAQEL